MPCSFNIPMFIDCEAGRQSTWYCLPVVCVCQRSPEPSSFKQVRTITSQWTLSVCHHGAFADNLVDTVDRLLIFSQAGLVPEILMH